MLGYTGAGKYNITNNATGTVVDLYNDSPQRQTPINGCNESSNDPAQIWDIIDEKGGTVSIINAGTGSYVTAPPDLPPGASNPTPETEAQCYGDPEKHHHDDDRGLWKVHQLGNGRVTFESAYYPGKLLDLDGSNPNNETPILAWGANGGMNQIWIPRSLPAPGAGALS